MVSLNDSDTSSTLTRLVFLTNTFPFAPGEEFIEAEIPFLAEEFDEVVVVPSLPYLRQGTKRELPENFTLLTPRALDGSRKNYGAVLRFGLRRPNDILGAAVNAVRSLPSPRKALEDFKLELFARMIVDSVFVGAEKAIPRNGQVVFYSYWMYAPARVAIHLKKRLRWRDAHVVSRAHGYDVFSERRASNYLPQRRLLFEGIEAVHPVSTNGTEYLKAKFPDYDAKLSTRRLGVAGSPSAGNPVQSEFLVYSCAYLHPVKRIPLLIEGIAEAQSRGVPVRWIHIGSSPDPEAVAAVKLLAQDLLTAGSFEFLGNLSNSEVREQYSSQPGSVFINTSESEGVPVSIMEALAQGLPVIATAVGGNPELVAPELGMFDGLLSANPTPAEIADRIEKLLFDLPEKYVEYVEGSRTAWAQRWSSERNYSEFARELKEHATRPHTR